MRNRRKPRPSWKMLSRLAYMQNKQGETAAARLSLRQLLARSPGNSDGLSLPRPDRVMNGDPQKAADLYAPRSSAQPRSHRAQSRARLLPPWAIREAAVWFERATQGPGNPLVALNCEQLFPDVGCRPQVERRGPPSHPPPGSKEDPSNRASNTSSSDVKGPPLAHLGQGLVRRPPPGKEAVGSRRTRSAVATRPAWSPGG